MIDKATKIEFPEAFAALGIRPSILRALGEEHFTVPTDIQALLIPKALEGFDILGQARTGTGKTAAFGIPILQKCRKDGAMQAMVLVPTRELAIQVDAEIKRLSKYTPIRSVPVYGGQRIAAQVKALKNNPPVVVGTPGRVIDLLDRRILDFTNLRFLILDEVDRMLDIGFRDDIRKILSKIKSARMAEGSDEATERRSDEGEEERHGGEGSGKGDEAAQERLSCQTIFVSATLSPEIEKLARSYMREPVEKLVAPGADEKPTVSGIEQFYLSVQPWDKYRLTKALLEQENPELAIIFCKTKHGAHKLAKKLQAEKIACREIHGNLAQNKRDRVMKSFRGGKFDVLVATDLASRGLDVAGISHIVNFDIPEDPEVYVHRIGRTARMGAAGKAFTLVTPEQGEELTRIESLINMIITPAKLEDFKPSPPPSTTWAEEAPEPVPPPQPAQAVTLAARPLTLGSRIPITRRHKRRR